VNLSGTVGDDSCNGYQACVSMTGEAGDGACNGYQACVSMTGEAGDASCEGYQACVAMSGSAGVGSCGGYQACVSMSGSAGAGSCGGHQACVSSDGDIGANSCQGYQTCVSVDAGVSIGDDSCFDFQSCVSQATDVGNCEFNVGCNVVVTKVASPSSIPSAGGTPVQYTVRIEFLDEVVLNSITDSEFDLIEAQHCRQGASPLGALPATFDEGTVIVCQYSYSPPPGAADTTYDNVATVNVGEECPLLIPISVSDFIGDLDAPIELDVSVEAQACPIFTGTDLSVSAITPGEIEGTVDVTAEASVRYVTMVEERRPPNIGAGLSGLFAGQPTPLPTAPGAVAPAATAPTISPPRTGDGGLVGSSGRTAIALGVLVVGSAGLAFGLRLRTSR
jgi:hypothetical protein